MNKPQKPTLLRRFSVEALLQNRPFVCIEGQLLFYSEQQEGYVLTQISADENYTVADYELLPEGAPFELIHQKLVFMASPEEIHQRISSRLQWQLSAHVFEKKLGELYSAPMDVHFDSGNVFQPDLLFVSIKRQSIIKRWIMGAPDFVVEIGSGSTQEHDRQQKMQTYGEHGVIEYWIVRPTDEKIEVYHNESQRMQLVQEAGKEDRIVCKAIEGFVLELKKVFGE